jgi:hypothetical protein
MSGKGAKGLSGKGLSGKGAKGTMKGGEGKGGDKKKPVSRSVKAGLQVSFRSTPRLLEASTDERRSLPPTAVPRRSHPPLPQGTCLSSPPTPWPSVRERGAPRLCPGDSFFRGVFAVPTSFAPDVVL